MNGRMAKGAVRTGPSLLAGLLRCGRCGRRAAGHVLRTPWRAIPAGTRRPRAVAWRLAASGSTDAIEREVLRVLTPGAIEAACTSAEAVDDETAATRQALDLELREARYEAERAQRQYDAVEPEHRLVAGTLEQRWNAALARVGSPGTAPGGRGHRPRTPDPTRSGEPAHAGARVSHCLGGSRHGRPDEEATGPPAHRRDHASSPLDTRVLELLIHWKGGKHTRLHVAPQSHRAAPPLHRPRAWSTSSAISPVACRTRRSRASSIASATGPGPAIRGPNSASSVSATRTTFPVYTPGVDGTALTIGQAADHTRREHDHRAEAHRVRPAPRDPTRSLRAVGHSARRSQHRRDPTRGPSRQGRTTTSANFARRRNCPS